MPSPLNRRREAEIHETLLLMMENQIYWWGGRWWSRDPATLTWQNDRFYRRRQAVLAKLGNQLYDSDPEFQKTRWPDWLTGSQTQYQILAKLAPVLASLPRPTDFPDNPDPRA